MLILTLLINALLVQLLMQFDTAILFNYIKKLPKMGV
jgi:hypothetical protein